MTKRNGRIEKHFQALRRLFVSPLAFEFKAATMTDDVVDWPVESSLGRALEVFQVSCSPFRRPTKAAYRVQCRRTSFAQYALHSSPIRTP